MVSFLIIGALLLLMLPSILRNESSVTTSQGWYVETTQFNNLSWKSGNGCKCPRIDVWNVFFNPSFFFQLSLRFQLPLFRSYFWMFPINMATHVRSISINFKSKQRKINTYYWTKVGKKKSVWSKLKKKCESGRIYHLVTARRKLGEKMEFESWASLLTFLLLLLLAINGFNSRKCQAATVR